MPKKWPTHRRKICLRNSFSAETKMRKKRQVKIPRNRTDRKKNMPMKRLTHREKDAHEMALVQRKRCMPLLIYLFPSTSKRTEYKLVWTCFLHTFLTRSHSLKHYVAANNRHWPWLDNYVKRYLPESYEKTGFRRIFASSIEKSCRNYCNWY